MFRTVAGWVAPGEALLAMTGCSGASSNPGADSLAIEGSVDLLPATSTALPYDMGVEPGLQVAYVAGGMGATEMPGLLRVDASNPAQMTVTEFAPGFGGGVAVDPATHIVATTDGYGPPPGGAFCTLGIFEQSGAMLDSVTVTGCGASIASAGAGRFAVSTQCVDSIAIYDLAARALVFEGSSQGVGAVVFGGATPGAWYQNRTPRHGNGGRDDPLVLAPVGPTAGALIESASRSTAPSSRPIPRTAGSGSPTRTASSRRRRSAASS